MISEKVQQALNDQLNLELRSAYHYLAMSAYFSQLNLNGFAQWIRIQAGEELTHAMKIYDFINDREGNVELADVKGSPIAWDNPLAVFENAYEHEREVARRINDIVDLSLAEKDHATNTFLQWFVTEQVEEEAITNEVVQKLKLVGADGNGLFIMDRDMAQRDADATE